MLMHWSYHGLVLSHQYYQGFNVILHNAETVRIPIKLPFPVLVYRTQTWSSLFLRKPQHLPVLGYQPAYGRHNFYFSTFLLLSVSGYVFPDQMISSKTTLLGQDPSKSHSNPSRPTVTVICSFCEINPQHAGGPSFLGLTRSISWLLMPWLLTSPGHQQPWYWLYRICRSWSYLRKDFNYLCHINVEQWHKM